MLKEKVCLAADSAHKEAEFQAELDVLKVERKAAAASAKAEVLEGATMEEEKQSCKEEDPATVPNSIPVSMYNVLLMHKALKTHLQQDFQIDFIIQMNFKKSFCCF